MWDFIKKMLFHKYQEKWIPEVREYYHNTNYNYNGGISYKDIFKTR